MSWIHASWIRAGFCVAVLAIGLVAKPLAAQNRPASGAETSEPSGTAMRDELQSIITRQMAAFGREDAAEAESFASPQLRDRFPDPSGFLAMVKENYGALVKPRSTHFDETGDSPHGPLQKVTVVANDGTVWTAVYVFERAEGSWRISGCGLFKQESQDI